MIAHDVLTYVSACSVGFPDEMVEITPYSYKEIDQILYNPDYIPVMREGLRPTVQSEDPRFDEDEYYADYIKYSKPINGKIPAVEVLSFYSAEPDWGMDDGLRLSPFQVLTGGSQGYRHLRYGLFGLRVGIVNKMFLYFNKLADEAFFRDDLYWGLRFSARAIHYLEDSLTPFHLKPFTESYIMKNLFSLKEIYFTTYNYHLNFERTIAYRLWRGEKELISAIQNVPPVSGKDFSREVKKCSLQIRKLFYSIFEKCEKMWGKSMSDRFVKVSRDLIAQMNPDDLTHLVVKWLSLSASAIKGYILIYVMPKVIDLL